MSFMDGTDTFISDAELAQLLANKGLKGKTLATALQVAKGESNLTLYGPGPINTKKKDGDFSLGLFQINFINSLAARAKDLKWTFSDIEKEQKLAALAAFNYELIKDDGPLLESNIRTIRRGEEGFLSPEDIWKNTWDSFNLVFESAGYSWKPWSVHPDSEQFKEVNKNNLQEATKKFNDSVATKEVEFRSIRSDDSYSAPLYPGNDNDDAPFDGMMPGGMDPGGNIDDPTPEPTPGLGFEPGLGQPIDELEDTLSGDFGSFEFLRGRSDADIVVNGVRVNFVDYLLKFINSNEDPSDEQITQQIDRYLPRTDWYKTTAPIRRATQAEWGQQGLGEDWESLTPARLGLIESKLQIVTDLLGREAVGQTVPEGGGPTAIQDIATLAYFYDWSDVEISKYIAGQTIDGRKGKDLLTEGQSQPGSQIRQIKTKLRTLGTEYLVSLSQDEENALAKRVYTGELPGDNLRTIFEEKARLEYVYLADFYDAGGTTGDFLSNYNPLFTRMLGRNAEWGGRDYALATSILNGVRDTKGFDNIDSEMPVGPLDSQESVNVNSNTASFKAPEDLGRVLNVGETGRAIRRTGEFDMSGFARAEMSGILNTVGQGMGFF